MDNLSDNTYNVFGMINEPTIGYISNTYKPRDNIEILVDSKMQKYEKAYFDLFEKLNKLEKRIKKLENDNDLFD